MARLSLRAVQKLTCKKRDAWWTVFLVDPVATRMLLVFARFRFITPNRVTWAALFIGLASAGFFLEGDRRSLLIGALLYHLSFILDCIDGKLARLKGNGTVFGGWLDYVFDRIRVLFCALALMGGQFLRTDDERFLLAALAVVFLDMLRYVDALQIYKMRMSMRTKIEKVTKSRAEADRVEREAQEQAERTRQEDARAQADRTRQTGRTHPTADGRTYPTDPSRTHPTAPGRTYPEHTDHTHPAPPAQDAAEPERPEPAAPQVVFMEDLLRDNPSSSAEALREESGAANVVDLHEQFRDRFPWYIRVRRAMLHTRVRPHLISGIEFQMFVFIVGPLIGRILWTTVVSAALLMLFELVIMYKFWLSTRDFTRVMEELDPTPTTAGTIAPQLHKGRHRHRRAVEDALLEDERYRAPGPEENPFFQPYPQPQFHQLDPEEARDLPGIPTPRGESPDVLTQPIRIRPFSKPTWADAGAEAEHEGRGR
ncbi:CDP-alcohol phosphatidyltransferase family protein [Streptomyces sp. NPDC013161]|uniref:CDP-alcohol phosphatidyltransferase family protein n=1 Tax=Streptomyces sp. NPDC013161 TaxID=3364862 RepID=UPI0036CFC0E3